MYAQDNSHKQDIGPLSNNEIHDFYGHKRDIRHY